MKITEQQIINALMENCHWQKLPKGSTAIKVVKIPEAAQEILKLIQHENQ